jgi:hypothetical protein
MKHVARLAIVLAAPFLLLGCLLTPGKFTSSLDIARDGKFAFKYQGEIILLTNKSVMDQMGSEPEFKASCQDDEGADRECSEAEVAEQRRAYDEEQAARKQREAKESAEMATVMGGIDPNNEATMDEFAARLQREAGWKKVVHRGGGVFDVDYEIAGNLDRDFLFPIFPRFDFIVPIVTVTRRDDNAILVRAPALGSSGGASGASGPMSGGGSKAEGVFTLTTGAAVSTNNSEEGPVSEGGKQRIEWRVTPLNRTAPEALLRL